MVVAVANARQTVKAPERKPRTQGLLQTVEVVDGSEAHWILGGLTADGELCSKPRIGQILCGALPAGQEKTSDSWYTELTGDPWVGYMFEKCRTVGRFEESESKVRERFLASENSAAERGFQTAVLANATALSGGAATSIPQAIAALEASAADLYGAQIVLHIPFIAGAKAKAVLEWQDDHYETAAGNLAVIGNYLATSNGGTTAAPVIYATGAVTLYRSDLITGGPNYTAQNEYYTLAERAYAAVIDCFLASTTGTIGT